MARSAASVVPRFRLHRSTLLVLLAAVLLLYAVVPQLGDFHNALHAWQHVRAGWIAGALLALLASYCLAALLYVLLAWKRLPFSTTVAVQAASMFANRLLPAGSGAISVNYLYLRRRRHSKPQAAAAVTLNNTLGFIGNMLLLAILLLTTSTRIVPPHVPSKSVIIYVVVAAAVIACVLVWWRHLRRIVWHFATATFRTIAAYRHRPYRLLAALCVSILLTGCYVLCLGACARALGLHSTLTTLCIVMTVGVAGSVLVPTPGGLGGAEAGLVAALTVYGTPSREALALALLYRLFTYWLSLLLGAVLFVFIERRQYI